LLELAGVAAPAGEFMGRPVETISGVSQVGVLSGLKAGLAADDRVLVNELFGKRSVRRGNWKLTHMPEPYGNNDWQLFDLARDIGEATDISAENPDVKREFVAEWQKYATENKVILPDWVSGY
jgi:arylsulfatase